MSEPLTRRTATVVQSPPLTCLPPCARWELRGDAQVMAAAGTVLGLTLSTVPCRASVRESLAALSLGPDEQLLMAPETEGPRLSRALARVLLALPHSLVEVGHRQVDLVLEGPHAAALLNIGCPLDLDPDVFPVGMCTRTVLAKAQIVLWRSAEATFRVLVARSYADYVSRFLAEGARESVTLTPARPSRC